MSYRAIRFAVLGFIMLSSARLADGAVADTFVHNGHTYRLYDSADARTFANATAFALSQSVSGQPGYLTRIDDAAENTRIFQSVMTFQASLTSVAADGGGGRYVWIGASDVATEGDWRWQDNNTQFWSGGPTGSAVSGRFNNWASLAGPGQTEPDNFPAGPAGQDAAGMSVNGYPLGSAGQWNDIADTNTLPFVVEFNVPEPAAVGVVGLPALWFALRRRRRDRVV